jgi:cytosine deaminase
MLRDRAPTTGREAIRRMFPILCFCRQPSLEAVRPRAPRLLVFRRGEIIARTPARKTVLLLAGRPSTLDPTFYAPREARTV